MGCFMSDEVPRRLKRFYRKRDELNQKRYKAQQEYYSQNTSEENEEQGFMNYEQISSQDSEKKPWKEFQAWSMRI